MPKRVCVDLLCAYAYTDMLIYRRHSFTPKSKLKVPEPPAYCMKELRMRFELEEKQKASLQREANKLVLRITCIADITSEQQRTVCKSKGYLIDSQVDSSVALLRALISSVSGWESQDSAIYQVVVLLVISWKSLLCMLIRCWWAQITGQGVEIVPSDKDNASLRAVGIYRNKQELLVFNKKFHGNKNLAELVCMRVCVYLLVVLFLYNVFLCLRHSLCICWSCDVCARVLQFSPLRSLHLQSMYDDDIKAIDANNNSFHDWITGIYQEIKSDWNIY